jgi:DNA/RNA-binding domain of Phe-tRNA-synthetase-like protein
MTSFVYDAALLDSYPTIHAGVIHATGLANGPASPELVDDYEAEQAATKQRLDAVSLAEVPSLAAWRRAFSAFGVKPTQYRNSAEALLRRLTKRGDIPSINTLVDIGNLVAIRYALPVAFFDQAAVTGTTTVRFAAGDERFTDLGADAPVSPELGEVVFVDDAGLVSARRWCWRQSDQSATGAETREVLVTVEGHHEGARDDVKAATLDLVDLLRRHQPMSSVVAVQLSADVPSVDF